MLKKVITIALIIFVAIAVLIGAYYLVVKTVEIITGPEAPAPKPAAVLPDKLKVLSDKEIFDYWVTTELNASTSLLSVSYYYLTPQGEILEAREDIDNPVATQPIKDLQTIIPSYNGALVLVSFGSRLYPQWSILNVKERSWQPLPLNIRSATFSPDGTQLALLISTDGKSDLIIQDLSAQPKSGGKLKSRKLLSLYQQGLSLLWRASDKIILSERPSDLTKSSAWQVDTKTGGIVPLMENMNGLAVQWSKDGKMGVIYSHYPSQSPILSIIDAKGKTLSTLDFIAPPDKCVFNSERLFCSVPDFRIASYQTSSLLDGYLKKSSYFSDTLYEYRQNAPGFFSSAKGISYGKPIDATHLTALNNQLLFVNRLDQKLYKLEL